MGSVIMSCGAGGGPVTGMPFSAQEITEKKLMLPNGTFSKQSLIALITRDAEGRTRREMMPAVALPGKPQTPGLTMISDPVAGYMYLLHPNMTALRSRLPNGGQLPKPPAPPKVAPPGAGGLPIPKPGAPQELGERMIEGFLAKGMRSITTVPAGFAGNKQPVQMVTESWCAKGLGAIVQNSHSDPSIGEVTTRLQGIQQTQPPSHLFQVPPGYQVIDAAKPSAPKVPNVAVPNVAVPNVAVPNVAPPNLSVPNVTVPNVAPPNVSVPNVAVPNVATPNVSVPNVGLPNVAAPSVPAPNVALPNVPKPRF